MNKEYEWLTEDSVNFLRAGYLLPGETALGRIEDIAERADLLLKRSLKDTHSVPAWITNFKRKFLHGMSKGWYSLSSPVWANFGRDRGLPISCFGSHVPDTMDGILKTAHEIGMMSKYGGGTAAYFGEVRGRGAPITDNGHSEGAVNFMRLFDTLQDVTKQGETRRGSTAVYLPVDHPDIMEFLDIRDDGNPIQLLSFAVTIPEGWMQDMIDGDEHKRKVWGRILQRRSESGMPYLTFMDNANNSTTPYGTGRYEITHSQLCNEIFLPTDAHESFVCCLSSMNLAKYDEWRDTDAVEVLTFFLDAVMTEFVTKAWGVPGFERAHRFAQRHRALGLGVLGWHSYLQQNMIPFGSLKANGLNSQIFARMQRATYRASMMMGDAFGIPDAARDLGLNRRNTVTMAIAPTTSSSFILGQVSPGIEPLRSNYFIRGLAKATNVYRNPELKKVLAGYGLDTEEVWHGILINDGSVQHIEELPEHVREVFKTFTEISQLDIIVQAGVRQQYIDQGQSLNIAIHPDTPPRDISEIHIEAWRRGLKGLYYQHGINTAQEFNRDLLNCTSCEG